MSKKKVNKKLVGELMNLGFSVDEDSGAVQYETISGVATFALDLNLEDASDVSEFIESLANTAYAIGKSDFKKQVRRMFF
mgnify:CR=1 FL=1